MTHFSWCKIRKIEGMGTRLKTSFITTVVATVFALSFQSVSVSSAQTAGSILDLLASGEVQIEEGRSRLMKLSVAEMQAFVMEAPSRLDLKFEKRPSVLFAFEILSRRQEFSKKMATDVLKSLKASRAGIGVAAVASEGSPVRSESRLALFLAARAGVLTQAMIEEELKFVDQAAKPSADRLAKLGALIDAMSEAGLNPSSAQLEKLLQNDVFEIRMLAVDWFRLHTPKNTADRKRFLQKAVKATPVQVRERAYRTIAGWSADDVKALGADVVLKTCEKDASSVIRSACSEIRSKVGKP